MTRIEAASAFPRRDSASQFQPVAAVFHRRMRKTRLFHLLKKRYQNPRVFSLSSPSRLPARPRNSGGSYRIGSTYSRFDGVQRQHEIHNRTGSHASAQGTIHFGSLEDISTFEADILRNAILAYGIKRPFFLRKTALQSFLLKNFLRLKCILVEDYLFLFSSA